MSEVIDNNPEFLLHGPARHGPGRNGASDSADASGSRVDASLRGATASLASLLGIGRRYLLAGALLACYTLFFASLYLAKQFDVSPVYVVGQFAVWLFGAAIVFRSANAVPRISWSAERLDLLLAIWCNVGVVAAATLLGGEMRLLLLIGVVFGLLYGGLHFSEDRVRSLMLATLVAYVGCLFVRSTYLPFELEFELLCALGLTVLLLSGSLMAREIVRLRRAAQARNRQLSQALRRVEELALRDELTGLYNRRHLLDFVDRAIASRLRGGPPFALAYCDLDHFKKVNDRFGHECGDRLLQAFAGAASASVRTNDLVARIGGEEFVLVLLDAEEDSASDIVERLRHRTAALGVSSAQPDYRVTLSVGLTSHAEGDTVDSLLRRADGALYKAKDEGRNRLIRA